MTRNPYSAPDASLGNQLPEAKKPIAFLIMQILLIPSALLFLSYVILVPLSLTVSSAMADAMQRYIASAGFFLLFAWSMAILIAAYRRKPVVRWLGGSAIALFIAAALYNLVTGDGLKSGDDAYLIGQLTGRLFVIGLLSYWLYAFAFSAKARRYLGLQ